MKALFTISLLFILSSGFGQNIHFENVSGKPISSVYISSANDSYGALSNEKGNVNLDQFKKNDVLTFTHATYKTLRVEKFKIKEGAVFVLLEKAVQLPEIYVNHPLRYFLVEDDESGQIATIPRTTVKLENPANSADMLMNTGLVMVQKSQGGGGSPIIRGFEANKLLLVIDGVRMNNAIYRSGHLQNSLTIDNSILDHTEIIFGPSSALYGSDALGGVIHFHTIDPPITHLDSNYFTGSSYIRYNTNNNTSTAHFNFSTGKKNWGLLNSFTASQFGDSKIGTVRKHGYSNWGKHPYSIGQINGVDSMISNPDPNIQIGSGYTQLDFMEKFIYQPNDSLKFTLNFQYSTSSKINRYDKLTEYKGSDLKYSEWYYGPQKRLLASAQLDFKMRSKVLDNGIINLSFQRIDEDRISRRFKADYRLNQIEDVNVFAINADFNKIYTKSRMIFYGLEVQHNYVTSTAFYENINLGDIAKAETRYPGLSNYLNSGIYLEFKQKFKNKAVFSAGIRYSFIYAKSLFEDTSFISLPFNTINISTGAPSGHLGLVLKPDSVSLIKLMATSGFRAPNIDDYGKVFEKNGKTVVPNNQLKPEYALGSEFSLERTFGKNFITFGGTVYGTYLFNAMVKKDFTLNGQDSIIYDGELTKVQAIQNTDNAIIYGSSAYLKMELLKGLTFQYNHNLTLGRDLSDNSPFAHIPPQFGKISFIYQSEKMNTSIYSYYNFRKKLSEYSTDSADNLDLTPNEEGTPPWWTLNFRFSYEILDLITLQFSAENILDIHYRPFASGISAPGRNFLFGIRAEF